MSCDGVELDRVGYDDGEVFPNARQASIARDGANLMGPNAEGIRWCFGQGVYIAEPEHRGTPGIVNPVCPMIVEGQCQARRDCLENQRCNQGVCEDIPEPQCVEDIDCGEGMVCRGQMCEMAPMVVEGGPVEGEFLITLFMSDHQLEKHHV